MPRKSTSALFAAALAAGLALPASATTGYTVLLTGAPSTADPTPQFLDVQTYLMATNRFVAVDFHNAGTNGSTPTLAQLQQYDAVLVWSNGTYASDIDLGNVLADYVDQGGGVVTAVFSTSTTTNGRSLAGRWDAEQYWIIEPRGGNTSGFAALGTILEPGHPTVANVATLSATSAFRPTTFNLGPGGRMIATWDDGRPLITVSDTRPGRVDLGLYPLSTVTSTNSWSAATTDGDTIFANALIYAADSAGGTCRPDLNGDGVVDADDFFEFLSLFAAGDLRADFNNDGVIDADDFFLFLNEFAAGC